MKRRLFILVLLYGGHWAFAQSCGVDFGTDAPGGSSASSRSNDPCYSGGFGPLLQQRPPAPFQPAHHDSLLAHHSIDPASAALSQQEYAKSSSKLTGRDQFRLLKTPLIGLKNILPADLLNTIGRIVPTRWVALPKQQIATFKKSHPTKRNYPSEVGANNRNSVAEATTGQGAQKGSRA